MSTILESAKCRAVVLASSRACTLLHNMADRQGCMRQRWGGRPGVRQMHTMITNTLLTEWHSSYQEDPQPGLLLTDSPHCLSFYFRFCCLGLFVCLFVFPKTVSGTVAHASLNLAAHSFYLRLPNTGVRCVPLCLRSLLNSTRVIVKLQCEGWRRR